MSEKEEDSRRTVTVTVELDHEPAVHEIEAIVKDLNEAILKHGEDSLQADFCRGRLRGANSIVALLGMPFKAEVLRRVRQRVGKMPTTIPLAPDGKRHGSDSDAG